MTRTLSVESFTLGPFFTNCYVVHLGEGGPCWIIDPGFGPEEVLARIDELKLEPAHALLTHGHVDHIAGLHDLRARWPKLPILIHASETDFLTDAKHNLSAEYGLPIVAPAATGTLEHGQTLSLDGAAFKVLHTPGHSPGGVTFYQQDSGCAIVGDTLFAQSIGRSDFPHSDPDALLRSIREQLLTLPDDTRVLPGHGPATTIGRERTGNPFLGA